MQWSVVIFSVYFVQVIQVQSWSTIGRRIDRPIMRSPTPCSVIRIKNARVRIKARSFAQYNCNKGYILAGERYLKCVQGQWDSTPPVCVRPNCQKAQRLENGVLHQSHRGGVLNFFCAANYVLQGKHVVYCVETKWDAPMPTCLPTNTTPSLSCDFETEGICGWTHDLNHNFDWKRLNFRTPSGHLSTGPSDDHTKGAGGNGYYMYIEASGRNMNDTARLISPMYKKESNNTCLEFYYHMYGSGIGQLRVYVKRINETWEFKDDDLVFAIEGNQGNEWLRGLVELGSIHDEFQVVFEGVRGFSYTSDIAIDDVTIVENCVVDPATTTEAEGSASTFTYDSCSNKCNTSFSDEMMCSCQEDCFDKNTCCPDYMVICVLGNDTDSTDSGLEFFSETNDITITLQSTEFTQKKKPTTIPAISTTQKLLTVPTTETPQKFTPIKTSTSIFTTAIPSSTVTENPKRTASITKYFFNDMLTAPMQPTTTEDSNYILIPDERPDIVGEYPTDEDEFRPVLSDKVAPVQEQPRPSNEITVIAVLTVCFVVVGVLGLVFMTKRYRSGSCAGVRRMRSGNGDSQSDVRFLTSDEILDFTVATPGNV